jgi:hypothetical protein
MLRPLLVLCAVSASAWAAIAAAEWASGVVLPGTLRVAVPFLFIPLVALRRWKQPVELGRIDRSFFLSAAVYAPFAAAAAGAAPSAPEFYAAFALKVAAPALAAWFVFDTFFHVGAVDFFSKRIVQREATALWGPLRGQAVQLAAWCVGHVVEWLWLQEIFGAWGAALYLVAAGLVTGVAYARWKNVAGLMVGHLGVNIAAAAAAVWAFG